jgi:hypothetical protein
LSGASLRAFEIFDTFAAANCEPPSPDTGTSDAMSATGTTFRRSRNSAQSSNAAISPKVDAAKTSTFTGGNVPSPLTTNALMIASARTAPAAQKKTAKIREIFMNLLITLSPNLRRTTTRLSDGCSKTV